MKKGLMRRDEMQATPISLTRMRNDNGDPYQNLANAIVCVAADDYRAAVQNGDTLLLSDLRRFFRSAWCSLLTNLDTEVLMEALDRERHSGPAAERV